MREVITMRDELFKGLTEEQIKKLDTCKDPEEVLALAKAEGVELSDEQLEAVSGGCKGGRLSKRCRKCNSANIRVDDYAKGGDKRVHVWYTCNKCGYEGDDYGWEDQFNYDF